MDRQPELTSAETVALPAGAVPSRVSSHVTDEGRFVAGTLLGGRYRIIGLLGQGGMGEVYRATDLTLGQSVASKFLPAAAAGNQRLLERFQGEVRVARQVSHPNVCRVYDIGEVEGLPFISMEYVDGEDLASLLKRIGRLPADRAVEVARKICAGLGAAHDRGVIHRDLKPQNVMMNKRGEVLIMDFGLAAIAGQMAGAEVRNGTPAYMAPEQLKGTEVSARSDLYSLGLVLYEIFTGRRPFEATSVPQLLQLQESAQLTSMSSIAADIDPAVERAVRRCLDPDPAKRPTSALAVAAALPGGDPLAAALAAGETPSPDLVAAAGATAGLTRKVALLALTTIILCISAAPFIRQKRLALHHTPLEYPPEVLRAKARELAARFGYTNKPVDSTIGLYERRNLVTHMNLIGQSRGAHWDEWLTAEAPFNAVYRESPSYLVAQPKGFVDSDNPPMIEPGMVRVQLDGAGRLRGFSAVPLQQQLAGPSTSEHHHQDAAAAAAPDSALGTADPTQEVFRTAQLNFARFKEVAPLSSPPVSTDRFRAWKGPHPSIPDTDVRLEVGSWRGQLTYARFLWHWDLEEGISAHSPASWPTKLRNVLIPTLLTIGALFAVLLARRNWRQGRVDGRGARCLALTQFSLISLFWAGWMHPVPDGRMIELVAGGLGSALLTAAITCLLYLALEPALRSRWPQSIVTWNRVLKGQGDDPQVWAHVLLGAAAGLLTILLISMREVWAIPKEGLGFSGSLDAFLGARHWMGHSILRLSEALQSGLIIFFLIFGLRVLLRNDWLAALAGALLLAATESNVQAAANPLIMYTVAVIAYFITIYVILLRLGLIATISAIFFMNSAGNLALGTDWGAWYAPYGLATLALMLGISLFAFWKSLGGIPLLDSPEQVG